MAFEAFAKESGMATPNPAATKVLGNLYNKFANQTKAGYADVLDEAQRLRLTAQGIEEKFPQVAKTLQDARAGMLDTLDSTSTLAKQAGALYRKDVLAKDILEKLRGANPGPKIRNLLEQEPSVAATFGLRSPAEIEKFANSNTITPLYLHNINANVPTKFIYADINLPQEYKNCVLWAQLWRIYHGWKVTKPEYLFKVYEEDDEEEVQFDTAPKKEELIVWLN